MTGVELVMGGSLVVILLAITIGRCFPYGCPEEDDNPFIRDRK